MPAVEWGVADAVRRDRPLHLVSVASKATTGPQPWTEDSTIQYSVAETERMIERVRRRYGAGLAAVTVEVPVGVPSKQLVKTLRPGDELVVGRRGVGPAERVILGSTSIEAAGRSPVPTVIVPDDWDQAEHASERVVAGVDGTERDGAVLEHAFALAERLAPWLARFPAVDVSCQAPAVAPGRALLDASADASMVVLGRYGGVHHLLGFSGFSTCRKVLHHARCPVSVVPVPTDETGAQ